MIYGTSNHPIEVKKIPLKIWSLRDEIEAKIIHAKKRLRPGEKLDIEAIKREYGSAPNVKPSGQLSDSEDEMAKALADAENLDDSEDAMAAALKEAEAGGDGEAEADKPEDEASKEAEPEASVQPEEPAEGEAPEGSDDEASKEGEQPDGGDTEAEQASEQAEDAGAGDDKKEMTDEEMAAAMLAGNLSPEVTTVEAEEAEEEEDDSPFRKQPKHLPQEAISHGIALLSDISMGGMLIFTRKEFIYGQTIVLKFDIPNSFVIGAEIVSTRKYSLKSRIISEQRPGYRVQLRFTFSHPGERTQLREFIKSIEPVIPKAPKKKPKPAEDDDDFDDLGL